MQYLSRKITISKFLTPTWIDIKCDAKSRATEIARHKSQTGGGPGITDTLPPIFEKILSLLQTVLISGDDLFEETGRKEPDDFGSSSNLFPPLSPDENTSIANNENQSVNIQLTSNIQSQDSSVEQLSMNPFQDHLNKYSTSRKHRKISAKSFEDLLTLEKQKAEALAIIAKEKRKSNELKVKQLEIEQERNCLYFERSELLANIANAFLQK